MQSTHWWYISDDCTVASKFPKCCKHLGPNIILVKTTDSLKVESISSWVGGFNLVLKKIWVKLDQNHSPQVFVVKIQQKKFETTTIQILQLLLKGPSIPRYLISCEKGIKTATSDAIPRFTSTYRNLEAQSFMRQPGSCFVVGSFGIGLLLRSSLNQW